MRAFAWLLLPALSGCGGAPWATRTVVADDGGCERSEPRCCEKSCGPTVAVPHPPRRRATAPLVEIGAQPTSGGVTRTVRFALNPGGARLLVDGRSVPWFGLDHALPPGEHQLEVLMPRELSHCCRPHRKTIRVEAGDEAMVVSLFLEYHDARAVLVEGPDYAFMTCRELGVLLPEARVVSIPMHAIEWRAVCETESGRSAEVVLRAGETTVVYWPLP